MTQTTLNEYKSEISKLQREQQDNIKEYNRQRTKASKDKVMYEKIVPLEAKIEEFRR